MTSPLRRFEVILCNGNSRYVFGERWGTEDRMIRFYGEGLLVAEFEWVGVFGVVDMAAQVGKVPEFTADDARPKRTTKD